MSSDAPKAPPRLRQRAHSARSLVGAVVPAPLASLKAAVLLVPILAVAAVAVAVSGPPAGLAVFLQILLVLGAAITLPRWPDVTLIAAAGIAACVAGLLVAGHTGWTVAAVALAALAQYPANRRSAGSASVLPVIVFVFASMPNPAVTMSIIAGWAAVGALAATALVAVLHAHVPAQPVERVAALRHCLLLAAGCVVLTWAALALHLLKGLWLVLTLCVVFVPVPGQSRLKALDRAVGTCAGGILAAVLLLIVSPQWALALAVICAVFATTWMLQGNYRGGVFWLTPAVLLSAGAGAATLGFELVLDRVVATAAVSLLAAAMALLLPPTPVQADDAGTPPAGTDSANA